MAASIPVKSMKRDGEVYIRCPRCRAVQLLPAGPDGYSIDEKGIVFPIFVCIKTSCEYEGHIIISNWK